MCLGNENVRKYASGELKEIIINISNIFSKNKYKNKWYLQEIFRIFTLYPRKINNSSKFAYAMGATFEVVFADPSTVKQPFKVSKLILDGCNTIQTNMKMRRARVSQT